MPINIGSNAYTLWMPRECGCGTAPWWPLRPWFRCGCPANAGAEQLPFTWNVIVRAVDAPRMRVRNSDVDPFVRRFCCGCPANAGAEQRSRARLLPNRAVDAPRMRVRNSRTGWRRSTSRRCGCPANAGAEQRVRQHPQPRGRCGCPANAGAEQLFPSTYSWAIGCGCPANAGAEQPPSCCLASYRAVDAPRMRVRNSMPISFWKATSLWMPRECGCGTAPTCCGQCRPSLWMPRECGCGTAAVSIMARLLCCGCPANAGAEQLLRVRILRKGRCGCPANAGAEQQFSSNSQLTNAVDAPRMRVRNSPYSVRLLRVTLWMPRECGCGTARWSWRARRRSCGCPANAGAEQQAYDNKNNN